MSPFPNTRGAAGVAGRERPGYRADVADGMLVLAPRCHAATRRCRCQRARVCRDSFPPACPAKTSLLIPTRVSGAAFAGGWGGRQ